MANIVLLSDGTGNSAAKLFKTNVWRTYQALDLGPDSGQAAFYDDGVGTSSFRPLAVLGGALGIGLKRNVRELYAALCRSYRDGDRIFGFGFSRGAYTIRVLAGMIAGQGLVDARAMHPDELDRAVEAAYDADRKDYKTKWSAWRAPESATSLTPSVPAGRIQAPIAFLGLWDTVDAYGLPIDELKRGLDYWLLGLSFPDQDLSPMVVRACHALALDDERLTFHPVLWNERFEQRLEPRLRGRLKQVWFSGVHSNVGGGYGKDGLAYVSLNWMLREAQAAGLKLHEASLDEFRRLADPHADRADSRAGLAAYYRYAPRRIDDLCNDGYNRVWIDRPKVHHSVLDRIKEQHVEYLPHVLPAEYDVVDAQGNVLPSNPYEAPADAKFRRQALEHAWDLAWWRRPAYYVTFALTVLLLAFPWLPWVKQAGGCTGPWCFVEPLLEALGGILPSWAETWTQAYRRHVGMFFVLAASLVASMGFGKMLERRIMLRASAAWAHLTGRQARTIAGGILSRTARLLRTSRVLAGTYLWLAREGVPALWALATVIVLVLGVNRLLFDVAEAAGLVCKGSSGALTAVAGKPSEPVAFATSQLCSATGLELKEDQTYSIRLAVDSPWQDASLPTSPEGFRALRAGTLVHVLGVPGRRSWITGWFAPVARIGVFGRDRYHLTFVKASADKDGNPTFVSEPFRARSNGELFLFVNDAVFAVPYAADFLYRNNRGTARLTVEPM